jgi:hypothetical protein
MSSERAAIIGALAYAAVAIVTFGHAANGMRSNPTWADAPADVVASGSLIAAAFWPLYWSWEAWS